MKMFTPGRLFLLLLSLMTFSLAQAEEAIEHIGNAKLSELMAQGVTLVDIRTEPEWQQTGVVEGAHTITLFDLSGRPREDFVPRLEALLGGRDAPVAFICRSGNRSAVAANALTSQLGFEKIYNVSSGMNGWLGEKRPVIPYQKP